VKRGIFPIVILEIPPMPDDEEPLDRAVELLVRDQLKSNEIIHGWSIVPTGDLVVFLCDREIERVTRPISEQVEKQLGTGRTLVFACENGTWSQVGLGAWRSLISHFLDYFQAMSKIDTSPHWQAGIDVCRHWIPIELDGMDQRKAEALQARLNSEPDPGPMWLELRRRIAYWIDLCGFPSRKGCDGSAASHQNE